jgi:sugar phosphate isomerase/epimerase
MKLGILAAHYTADLAALRLELEELRALGYECIDYQGFTETETELFSMSDEAFEKYLRDVKEILDGVGLSVSQTHGPWRYPPQDATEEDRAERFEKMAKSIRGCALLGCPYMVIHNVMPYGPRDLSREVVWEINTEFMGRLIEVGREHGVVVCMENMPFIHQHLATPKALLEFVRTFDSPWLRLCLDTGHAAVFKNGTTPADAVRLWGTEYLRTMHVHDNDGRRDCHWMPGKGVIDWADFAAALQEIGYKGVLSLETAVPADVTEDRDAAERALANTALTLAGR